MIINRKWAMPSADTFSIKPIRELLDRNLLNLPEGNVIDPFVRNSPYKNICISNDLDPSISANFNMDALEFLKTIESESASFVFYDPPYSVRQVSECYKKLGMTVNNETTRSDFWTKLKAEVSRIIKKDGIVASFGWNSGGIGKKLGFEIIEILMVAHGGIHNDTICTVEKKI
jgi:hypothetical protein